MVAVGTGPGAGCGMAKYAPAATAAMMMTITIAACTRVIALLDNFPKTPRVEREVESALTLVTASWTKVVSSFENNLRRGASFLRE